MVNLAAKLLELGYDLDATHGTAVTLGEASINPRLVNKVHEGPSAHSGSHQER